MYVIDLIVIFFIINIIYIYVVVHCLFYLFYLFWERCYYWLSCEDNCALLLFYVCLV